MSQLAVLQAAACHPATKLVERDPRHHDLVRASVEHLAREEHAAGGQLGKPSGARYKTYMRLKGYTDSVKGTIFDTPDLHRAIDDIFRHPLRQAALDTLNRQLKAGIDNQALATLVMDLREDGELSIISDESEPGEPQIICSLGLVSGP